MCGPAVAVPIVIAAASAVAQGVSSYVSAQSERAAAKGEAKIAKQQAADASYRGGLEAGEAAREGSRVAGEQRVAMAAAGIDLESDFARNLQLETRARAGLDVSTIKANAASEAWGFQAEAAGARFKGKVATRKSHMAFVVPGINFASSAAGTVDEYRRNQRKKGV